MNTWKKETERRIYTMSKIWGDHGNCIGSIDSLGRIRDDRGYDKGRIDSNGEIYDEYGNYKGVILENGHIYKNGSYVGLIDNNGDVLMNGRRVGHIDDYREVQPIEKKPVPLFETTSKNKRVEKIPTVPLDIGDAGDMFEGILGFFLFGVVIALVAFVGKVFKETIDIIKSPGMVMVLLLAFIGTWIADSVYNYISQNKRKTLKTPIWGYVVVDYLLLLAAFLIIRQGSMHEIFWILFITLILTFIMTICSTLFHLTYKNEVGVDVKIVCILIPLMCLFAFSFYARSHGMYPYVMNYSSEAKDDAEDMPGAENDKYSFDSNDDESQSDELQD